MVPIWRLISSLDVSVSGATSNELGMKGCDWKSRWKMTSGERSKQKDCRGFCKFAVHHPRPSIRKHQPHDSQLYTNRLTIASIPYLALVWALRLRVAPAGIAIVIFGSMSPVHDLAN